MTSYIDTTLIEFVNFGIDYLLSFFDMDAIIQIPQVIPDGHIFYERIAGDVFVTQTLMRWYYKQLFDFTFVKEQFMSDVVLYWWVWIQNRHTMYERVIDAFAIIIEAKLYSDAYKSYPMSSDNCKDLFFQCFEYLKNDFYFFGGWESFYSDVPAYPYSIMDENYNMYHLKNNFIYENFNDTFYHTMQKSVIKFPIEKHRENHTIPCSMAHTKYVFVRLPTEMGRCYVQRKDLNISEHSNLMEFDIEDGSVVMTDVPGIQIKHSARFIFAPQDRKHQYWDDVPNNLNPIRDEEEKYDDLKMMDWRKIFSHAILKISDNLANIVLISPRYNNSLEKMLAKRYSGSPGRFFGDSKEFSVSHHYILKSLTQDALSDDTEGINWIDAVHLTLEFFFLRKCDL